MRIFLPTCIYLTVLVQLHPVQAEVFFAGDLSRKADPGFRLGQDSGHTVIQQVEADSAAAQAGLQKGDVVLAINGREHARTLDAAATLSKLPGGKTLDLVIVRGGRKSTVRFTPPKRAYESIPGADSYYGVVNMADGARLRTLIAVPAGSREKLPAIFFVQWVSCGSLEYIPGSISRGIHAGLVRQTGRALIRVERTTSGDSEGPACHELDYDTELEHYLQAYRQLQSHPRVDTDNIILFGSSLGSTMAPLLAEKLWQEGIRVKGIMVQGGGGVTYLERMIAFERIYLERRPEVSPESIHREIQDRILFYTEYFIKGRHPATVAGDSPAMQRVFADIRGLDAETQYGRPHSWHQQAARHNFLRAWHTVQVPVLVVFNEYDQYESEHGHRMISDMINRWRPGTATYVRQKGIGHSNQQFSSLEEAYRDETGKPVPEKVTGVLSDWVNKYF